MLLAFIHIFLILLGLWFISKRLEIADKQLFWAGWFWRSVLGLAFGYVYLIWLDLGDTIYFFEQGSVLAQKAISKPADYLDFLFSVQYPDYKSEARNTFFIKLVSLFCLITSCNYWIITLYFSTISFLAVWWLFTNILTSYPSHKWALILGFLVIPSPIFWTSGILKDAVVFSSFLFIATVIFRHYQKRPLRIIEILGALLAAYLLWKLRYFIFAFVFVGSCVVLFQIHISPLIRSKKMKAAFWISTIMLLLAMSSFFSANLNLNRLPVAIYENYSQMLSISDPGKTFVFDLKPTWISILSNIPKSLFSGLFLPVIGNTTLLHFPYGLENLLLLTITFFSAYQFLKRPARPDTPAVVIFFFILSCASIFPIASPNIGTFMRYKAIYLPFLIYLISIPIFNSSLFQKR